MAAVVYGRSNTIISFSWTFSLPPLSLFQWSRQLKAVAFSHPYVLALSDELVTIHSILDFTQKQAISFIGGVVLGDFDGKLFIASPRWENVTPPFGIAYRHLSSLICLDADRCYFYEDENQLFVFFHRSEIYALIPVSWEKQVQGLLEDGRVDEALDLAQNSRYVSFWGLPWSCVKMSPAGRA